MNVVRGIVLYGAVSVLAGCALGTMSKVNELQRGMTTQQVKGLMGAPESTQLINGLPVWRYSLHEYFVGWVPHYLVFNEENQLIGWKANMNEYYANQMMWMSAIESMQRSSPAAGAGGRGPSNRSAATSERQDYYSDYGSITHDSEGNTFITVK
jgi:hypothetical protein